MPQPSCELPIVLASASPRRLELLTLTGLPFLVDSADVDETASGTPDEVVTCLAQRKARAVRARHPHALVIGADTIVYFNEILGKPRDRDDAVGMLRKLSGQWHTVYTGICCLHTQSDREVQAVIQTRVHIQQLAEQDIQRYVDSGEPMDKAGAYAMQGRFGVYIDAIDGSPSNVIGLPLAALRQLLARFSVRI